MLGIILPKDISSWDSSQIRCYLISKTAGFRLFIKRFKKEHGLSSLSNKEINDKLDVAYVANDELRKHINMFSDDMNLPDSFFENMLIGVDGEHLTSDMTLPIYIATDDEPLRDGFYIRVDRFTDLKTIRRSFLEIKDTWKKPDRSNGEPENDLVKRTRGSLVSRDTKKKDFQRDISAFILIEKYIYLFMTKKRMINDNDTKGDKRVVSEAIDEVSLSLVERNLVNKKTYVEQIPNTKNNYRRLLKKYSIPPLRDFQK